MYGCVVVSKGDAWNRARGFWIRGGCNMSEKGLTKIAVPECV